MRENYIVVDCALCLFPVYGALWVETPKGNMDYFLLFESSVRTDGSVK